MRFATYEQDRVVRAGVVTDAGVHAMPAGSTHRAGVGPARAAGRTGRRRGGRSRAAGPALGAAGWDRDVVVRADERVRVGGLGRCRIRCGAGVAPGADVGGSSRTVPHGRWRQPDEIFGYTVFNDWSARDLQRREMPVSLGPAKGKDSAITLGHWLVTADEIEPYRDTDGFLALDMRVSVNGGGDRAGPAVQHELAVRGARRLRGARHPGARRRRPGLRYLRQRRVPSPSCGVVAGHWSRRRWAPGDVVEMTVEGIGTIRNTVVAGRDPPAPPPGPRPITETHAIRVSRQIMHTPTTPAPTATVTGGPVPRFARLPVLAVAGVVALMHLVAAAFGGGYWFDESLMLVIGREHLDWGSADQPL